MKAKFNKVDNSHVGEIMELPVCVANLSKALVMVLAADVEYNETKGETK